MGKKGKEKDEYSLVYIVTAVSDIFYDSREEGCKLGIGNTYVLGIYTKYSDVLKAIEDYNNSDFGGEPLTPWFKEEPLNYIVVDSVEANEFTDVIETRDFYTFVESEESYVHIEETNVSEKFSEVLNKICSVESGFNLLNTPITSLSNTAIISMPPRYAEICDLKECDFDDIDETSIGITTPVETEDEEEPEPEEVPFEEMTNEEARESIKEFISDNDNKLTINRKKIKSDEDVDNLTDEDIEDFKTMKSSYIISTKSGKLSPLTDFIDPFFQR